MTFIRNFDLNLATAVILVAIFAASCGKKELVRPGDPLPEAYEKAYNLFDKGKFRDAANAFEMVVRAGRGTDYGRDAQYYLAESYYNDRNYLRAASEYERFISLYPRSERRQEAEFKKAFCYYKLSPRYRLDQTYTRQAIEAFRLFQSRYPDSDRVQKAAEYISELRGKLAHKMFNAAVSYFRWGQYEAATIYYEMTIDQYPETKWAERSLVNLINAYVVYADRSVRNKQRERYQKAVDNYEKYLQLYPRGKYRSQADEYVDEARVALENLGDRTTVAAGDSTNR